MMKVKYNDQLVYIRYIIWAVFLISLWKEKLALSLKDMKYNTL